MNRRVAAMLAVAAVAVVIQNVVYFSGSTPQPGDPEELLAGDSSETTRAAAPTGLADVCADALADFLASLPDLEQARSSFLTRAEALALAASGTPNDASGIRVLRLEGTLVNPQRRIAWLDGIVAGEGGWVGDHEVLRIESRSVVVKKGADELRIDLRKPVPEDPES